MGGGGGSQQHQRQIQVCPGILQSQDQYVPFTPALSASGIVHSDLYLQPKRYN